MRYLVVIDYVLCSHDNEKHTQWLEFKTKEDVSIFIKGLNDIETNYIRCYKEINLELVENEE